MFMIDWITAKVPCNHAEEIVGGHTIRVNADGELQWQIAASEAIQGSYDAAIQIKTSNYHPDQYPNELWISGNPVKWLQGHNVFGSSDLVALLDTVLTKLSDDKKFAELMLAPTELQRKTWQKGYYNLSRVDVTASFACDSRERVQQWLRAAEHGVTLKSQGVAENKRRGQLTGHTLYYGKHSRRWALKFYSKATELTAKDHRLPINLRYGDDIIHWAQDKLRCELTLRQLELKRLGLELAGNWSYDRVEQVHKAAVMKLNVSESIDLDDRQISELPPRLVGVYRLWEAGNDLKKSFPRATYYRYKKELLKYGIDISQHRKKRINNVVPLIRYIEAKPVGIPDWAKGTSAYFEPRQKTLFD